MGITNPVHLAFIAMIALIVLGPKRLPELAKSLGHGMREFRESLSSSMEADEPDLTIAPGSTAQPGDTYATATDPAPTVEAVPAPPVAPTAPAVTPTAPAVTPTAPPVAPPASSVPSPAPAVTPAAPSPPPAASAPSPADASPDAG
jgi:TatA/E family protein of Tat protein translocase